MRSLNQIVDHALDRFENIPEETWTGKESPVKWSKKEILGHLVDSAVNNLRRFTEIRDAVSPYKIPSYNQDQLVVANYYQQESLKQITALWVALNRHIAFIMDQQTTNSLQAKVVLGDGSTTDLGWLMKDYIDHLEHHLNQILVPQVH